MNLAERILVVVEQSESAALVLEKAAMLAHAASDVEVQIIQVIYDPLVEFNHLPAEAAQAVKLELMQGEERKRPVERLYSRGVVIAAAVVAIEAMASALVDVNHDLRIGTANPLNIF